MRMDEATTVAQSGWATPSQVTALRVACVMPHPDRPEGAWMMHTMQAELTAAGAGLWVAGHGHDLHLEATLVKTMLARGADALILVGERHHERMWPMLRAWGRPTLLVGCVQPCWPSLTLALELGVKLAVEHVLSLGHRRLGMISGVVGHDENTARWLRLMQAALRDAGLNEEELRWVQRPCAVQGGASGLQALLAGPWRPTALLCSNDLLAAGALTEASRLGLRVPQALSVVGFDDLNLARAVNPGRTHPPLTSVQSSWVDMGRLAAQRVLSMLRGEPHQQHEALPLGLVLRGSVDKVPGREPAGVADGPSRSPETAGVLV